MKPLKVSELNKYIKRVFASDMILSNIQIKGEISNFKRHISGHLYFSLKDNNSVIKCVMFKDDAQYNSFDLSEGQNIIAQGYVSIYERNGEYQLYVKSIKADGIGELYRAYEILKNKLEKDGVFDDKFKKDLPFLPKNIGVVTSATGAAVHDIINVINRRSPASKVSIYPSLVQGDKAYKEIIQGLTYLDNDDDIEVIILARGGGSMEDLFCFNNEKLARCVFNLKTPIISAIGHETDFTIVDFISDLRAPTPSAAAELVVPSKDKLAKDLNKQYNDLKNVFTKFLKYKANQMNIFKNELKYNNPYTKLQINKQEIDMLYKDLSVLINNNIDKRMKSLLTLENNFKMLDPLLSLQKGHAILLNNQGNIIRSLEDVNIDDFINIKVRDGNIKVSVKDIKKESNLYGE